ncbi:EstA protein [Pluteus cervinus]|uniref:EstA protein n=1 Tax=Pluteus cervinus TaxID=181527 RepID=A0ACD3B6L3_9AGAR|nr:EstA protein [Pluteus cervinus]
MAFLAVFVLVSTLFWQFHPLRALVISPDSADIIDAGYAKYLGSRAHPNSVAYLGIPYAEPPLGERRFRAPLPLDTKRLSRLYNGTVVDATAYPEFCIQGTTGGGDAGGAGSEDCLKVNIYAPVGATRRSKRYIYGNPRNWPFEHWVQQSPNVVIVSVYYRLSSFGFLAVPEFRDQQHGDFNAGFMDQIQALRWVKENIASFGGDPSKVTINGESAGGSSVELHIVSQENLGEKLFSQAIAQSVYRTPLPTSDQRVPLFQFYADQAGCGAGSVAEQLACLRKASVSALARAQDAAKRSTSLAYNSFQPVLDGQLFRESPTISILNGRFPKIPLIVGSTSNESLGVPGGIDVTSNLHLFFPSLPSSDIQEIESLYPISDYETEAQRVQVAVGESQLICARSILGHAFSKHGQTWTYRYNQRNPTSGGTAVYHAAENWMMFLGSNTGYNGTTTFTTQTPIETAFSQELIAYWLSFVRSGNPNTFKLPQSPRWGVYSEDRKARIVLQQGLVGGDGKKSGSFVEAEDEKETSRCEVVGSKAEGQQN